MEDTTGSTFRAGGIVNNQQNAIRYHVMSLGTIIHGAQSITEAQDTLLQYHYAKVTKKSKQSLLIRDWATNNLHR